MMFTLWNVGHGLSIWIRTPAGHNHWIDAGWYPDTGFCPAKHVKEHYGERCLDYLIISHPDSDHLHNLPSIIDYLGEPRVLCRNKTLPTEEKYGTGTLDYQRAFKHIDERYTHSVLWPSSPCNPDYSGGVTVKTGFLDHVRGMPVNDTSIVALYAYAGWLFICPGDIGEDAWDSLWSTHKTDWGPLVQHSKWRVLVAPHHGRCSGYSQTMMDALAPHLVLISDEYGKELTDRRFRENPLGLTLNGELVRFYSTKSGGRLQFSIDSTGSYTFSQYKEQSS